LILTIKNTANLKTNQMIFLKPPYPVKLNKRLSF
jgi:hypothetical protein